RDRSAGIDHEAAELLEAEAVLFAQAHVDVDELVFLTELGGGPILDLVADEIGDVTEAEAEFGETIAVVDHLDFGMAGLKARPNIHEARDHGGESTLRLAAKAFERGEIVAADLDFNRALEAEQSGIGNLDLHFGHTAELLAN